MYPQNEITGYKSDKICTRLQNSDEQNQRTRQKGIK